MAYLSGTNEQNGLEVAVIGMSGRFPGASDPWQFWDLLVGNKEAITFFPADGINDPFLPAGSIAASDYIRARGIVSDAESFDAGLFGYNPGEAKLLDPQVRVFHECAWEALEDAGYSAFGYPGLIGVFAGANDNAWWQASAMLKHNDRDLSNKDFLASRLSYKLNLRGPSQTLFSACSTSLVSVHTACRSLLSGECNIAIAGGVSIEMPQNRGYLYSEEGILSSSGHNRSFDAAADGTVFSNGAGVVVLKLLEDAIKDNDNIHAVIKGTAINNDGGRKVSFTAPSIQGQVDVIREALTFSAVEPGTIRYIETHGSATPIGDPIEVEALKKIFNDPAMGACGIGSVKSNIGHTNAAAGIAGLLKIILSLKKRIIPASINFDRLNTNIDLQGTPLYVVAANQPLEGDGVPLRMGVTSLGVGGSNAHVILEEAPVWRQGPGVRPYNLLTFSAKTANALQGQLKKFSDYLDRADHRELVSAAYTLSTGRTAFSHRGMAVIGSPEAAKGGRLADLCEYNSPAVHGKPGLVLCFPDSDFYYQGMARELYAHEAIFRNRLGHCWEIWKEVAAVDLAAHFWETTGDGETGAEADAAIIRQALAFSVQYAVGSYLIELGVTPDHIYGLGVGEIAAAAVRESVDLPSAVRLLYRETYHGLEERSIGNTLRKEDIEEELRDNDYLVVTVGSDPVLAGWFHLPGKQHSGRSRTVEILCGRRENESLIFTRGIGNLWLAGCSLNWEVYYREEDKRRISLPTYSFDKKRYEMEGITRAEMERQAVPGMTPGITPGTTRMGEAVDWLYYPSWRQAALVSTGRESNPDAGRWLLFAFPHDVLAGSLTALLRASGQQVTVVHPGEKFEERGDCFSIGITGPADYFTLFSRLRQRNALPGKIIHLWNHSYMGQGDRESFENAQYFGYYSIVYLGQVLSTAGSGRVSVSVVSALIQQVLGGETTDRTKSTLLGAISILPHEHPWIRCRNIDFETFAPADLQKASMHIIAETNGRGHHHAIAYRNGRRWVLGYEKYLPGVADLSRLPLFKNGGVYLIAGGLGNMGIHLAEYISRKIACTLVLAGRREFPSRSGWDELSGGDRLCDRPDTSSELREKIRLLKRIEENGSKLEIKVADIGVKENMERLWQEVIGIHGKVDGVIHAAGIQSSASNLCTLDLVDKEVTNGQFHTKIDGLYVLEELFRQYEAPDFCILMSSLATVLGGIGFTAYCAANSFMDHFSQVGMRAPVTRWKIFNWDAWRFGYGESIQKAHDYQMTFAMTTEEALQAFHIGLYLDAPPDQIIVSTGDIDARLSRQRQLVDMLDGNSADGKAAGSEHDRESILKEIWKKHLGHQDIGRKDNFFQLGGNSFLLIALLNDVRIRLGRRISIKDFYRNPRISGMLELLQADGHLPQISIKPSEKKEYYPCSAAQKRMYYHYTLDPDGTNYNETKIFEVPAAIDRERLESAWNKMICRHEALRTVLLPVDLEPMQFIADAFDLRIEVLDGSSGEIMDVAQSFVRPFDLSRPPLFRIGLVHMHSGRSYLLYDFHHIVFDAVTMNILRSELVTFLEGGLPGPVKWQYKDISEVFNSTSWQGELSRQRAYWLGVLKDFSGAAQLPRDHFRDTMEAPEEAYEQMVIAGEELATLRSFVCDKNISLFSLIQGGVAILVSKYAGTNDITIGVPVSGRSLPEMNSVVGMFVNVLPLRTYPGGDASVLQFLNETQRSNSELQYHQDYPYNELVNAMRSERGIDFPIFNLVFNMVTNMPADLPERLPGASALFGQEVVYSRNRVTKFDLIVNVTESAGRIHFGINYSPRHYRPETIGQFLRNYRNMLFYMPEHENGLLSDIRPGGLYDEVEFHEEMLTQDFNFQ